MKVVLCILVIVAVYGLAHADDDDTSAKTDVKSSLGDATKINDETGNSSKGTNPFEGISSQIKGFAKIPIDIMKEFSAGLTGQTEKNKEKDSKKSKDQKDEAKEN